MSPMSPMSPVSPVSTRPISSPTRRRGITIVEILTVVGIIILLLAILLPSLGVLRSNAVFARSQGNLRQIGTWLKAYSTDNREFVVPAAFDYRTNPSPGKVRTVSPPGATLPIDPPSYGSWSDIIWTDAGLGPVLVGSELGGYDYRFDSPDFAFYNALPDYQTPIRSDAENTRTMNGDNAFPFGSGSRDAEKGQFGYFAANGFFDARPENNGRWFTSAQIKRPFQSLYLVDSYAGEVIAPECEPFGCTEEDEASEQAMQVDFRYVGDIALILTLDGAVKSESRWQTLRELEQDRRIQVQNLDL